MADSDNESGGGGNNGSSGREQDRFLPIANVSRIMKKALPANAKISKEAKETVQECVSEFISFITGEASDKCLREKRKTINGDDLLWAMSTLGFDDYIEPLKLYLHKFRELEGDRQGAGTGAAGGGSASSSSSQPTDVLGGGGNVGGSYGSGLYGTGAGGAGSGASGMMVMGQQLYGGSPTSGSLYQHQQHQMGGGLFRGGTGGGTGGGGGGSSSPSGRRI
ncbi:Nuclear transcription factor Y subunit B [Rhynchospora pubera]|uniref:Nuclear transcription factor Y subunit B n=1 Tax=Rhynchospora pubera TaxID=906938 RepID=A0AAV8FBC4_9POAL|nr:Nuclear transcription factor Y subunit B [Rhynchospora pubera]KAJ4781275.1 Nuclear transcription factor Y subunit B [Rhynchospora pubera]KAJ4788217.1 Nuclear transcription factor Y subunit B [Rhynchospora pubera]